MRIQITLTVEEAKRVIAKGIAALPEVRLARAAGKLLLKGGTTVSAVSEELCGTPLSILGRISPKGARTAQRHNGKMHCALLVGDALQDIDGCLEQTAASLGKEDVVIIGANAIDTAGQAAMMYGASLGGPPGRILSGLMAEHGHVIIAAGLEKLIPDRIETIVRRTSRLAVDAAMGMAVGLTPLIGKLVTEVEAIRLLADVEVWVIGKGGIHGAEGATTLAVEGKNEAVEKIIAIVKSVHAARVSGVSETLDDCVPPHSSCKRHRRCIDKKGGWQSLQM